MCECEGEQFHVTPTELLVMQMEAIYSNRSAALSISVRSCEVRQTRASRPHLEEAGDSSAEQSSRPKQFLLAGDEVPQERSAVVCLELDHSAPTDGLSGRCAWRPGTLRVSGR